MDKKVVNIPRGIRNNNPLNIEYAKHNSWLGQLPYNKVIESRFCRFSQMRWGFRAAAILIKRYMNACSLTTPRLIINKWAPAIENNTNMYLKRVCAYSDLGADQELCFNNELEILMLISAMCRVENGDKYNPQNDSQLWQAMYEGYIDARG